MTKLFSNHRVTIGFGFSTYCLIILWLSMTGHSSAFVSESDWLPFPLERYVFLAAQVSSLFFLAFFGGSVSRMRAFPSWLFCLCFIIGSVVFVFAGYQEIVAIQMATALGCALMAAGFSWCLLSFWRYLKYYLTIKAVGIILIVGIAVAYTIYLFSEILITDFGRGMLLLATTALLLSATICLNRLENPVPKETRIGSSASDGLMKEYLDTEQNGGGGGVY